MPSSKYKKEDFYDQRYIREGEPGKSDEVRVSVVLKLIGSNKKVLDLGCSSGRISQMILKNQNDVYGVDVSEKSLKLARQKGINVQKADIEESLPFTDGMFDVVVAGELIEHILDTDRFLEEIRRVLNNGGSLVLTTPNLASLGRRMLLLLGMNPLMEVSFDEQGSGGHIRYFVKSTLLQLLRYHGFAVDYFGSDVVNFNNSGTLYSIKLARLIPTLGRSLIVKARLSV